MRRIATPDTLRYIVTAPLAFLLLGICFSGERLERLMLWIDPKKPKPPRV